MIGTTLHSGPFRVWSHLAVRGLLGGLAILAAGVSALGQDPPAYDHDVIEQPPANNPVPPKVGPCGGNPCPEDTPSGEANPGGTPSGGGAGTGAAQEGGGDSGGGEGGGGEVEATPDEAGGSESDTGDPVVLHNGMVSYQVTDMVIKGRGMDFVLTRQYSSHRSGDLGSIGYGWEFNFGSALEFPDGYVGGGAN